MKPQEPLAVPPDQNNLPLAQEPLAEPPKNVEVTEVPIDGEVHNPQPVEPPKQPEDGKAASDPTAQPTAEKPAQSPKPSGPKKPVLGVAIAVIIFVGLAAAAYYAYTKS